MKTDIVKCRFSKCSCLHETNYVSKDVAVKDGKIYYHPDCFDIKQKVAKIKEYFIEKVNPDLSLADKKALTSVCYNLIFEGRKLSPDFIMFAIKYYVMNKPGYLRFPPGISRIVKDPDVEKAWKSRCFSILQREMRREQAEKQDEGDFEFNLPETKPYAPIGNRSRFSMILR